MGAKRLNRGRNVSIGGETSHIGVKTSSVGAKRLIGGAKRLKLGQVVTATGANCLEDGCETSWGRNVYGAKCPGAEETPGECHAHIPISLGVTRQKYRQAKNS